MFKSAWVFSLCCFALGACAPQQASTSSEEISEVQTIDPQEELQGEEEKAVEQTIIHKNITVVKKANDSELHPMVVQFLSAQGLIARKQYTKAEGAVELLLKAYPKVAATFVLASDLRRAQGKLTEAKEFLERAAKLAPDDGAILASMTSLGEGASQ